MKPTDFSKCLTDFFSRYLSHERGCSSNTWVIEPGPVIVPVKPEIGLLLFAVVKVFVVGDGLAQVRGHLHPKREIVVVFYHLCIVVGPGADHHPHIAQVVSQVILPCPYRGCIGPRVFKPSIGDNYILQRTCAAYGVLVYKLPQVVGMYCGVNSIRSFFGDLLACTVVNVSYFFVIPITNLKIFWCASLPKANKLCIGIVPASN